jgi:hypothetical protein
MPINLVDVENDVKSQVANIGYAEPINFKFRISYYTPAVGARLRNAEDPMKTQIETMDEAIIEWDVVEYHKDAEGKYIVDATGNPKEYPVPVSVEAISRFSIVQINAIYRAMEELAFPPEPKAEN